MNVTRNYKFNIYCEYLMQPGTYMYHAHYGMQRETGVNGFIKVSVPSGQSEPFTYDYDRTLLLTDWYHKSTYEQAVGLSSIPFVWVGEPKVILSFLLYSFLSYKLINYFFIKLIFYKLFYSRFL